MSARLSSKTAIITGSSSGIGRAIALAFSAQGAKILCSDIHPEPRNTTPETSDTSTLPTHELITSSGGTALYQKCDTTSATDVENLIKRAVSEWGRLNIMINNAGVAYENDERLPIWDYPIDRFDKTLSVNLRGVFLGCKYASQQMRTQEPGGSGDRGWIVNVASVLGLGGSVCCTGYVSSKHGVMGLTKAAALDCASERIHVNAICPGYTATSMTKTLLDGTAGAAVRDHLASMHPFKGFGEPEDIARAAVFLASEDCSWITGVGLPVDGGYSSL